MSSTGGGNGDHSRLEGIPCHSTRSSVAALAICTISILSVLHCHQSPFQLGHKLRILWCVVSPPIGVGTQARVPGAWDASHKSWDTKAIFQIGRAACRGRGEN